MTAKNDEDGNDNSDGGSIDSLHDGVDGNLSGRELETGQTPLHAACVNGDFGHVQLILQSQRDTIDVNVQDDLGMTPLHYACQMGHAEVVRILLEQNGIDMTIENMAGLTPFHQACCSGKVAVVERFLQLCTGLDIHRKRGHIGTTPMHDACSSGCLEIVQLMLRHGNESDVNVVDNLGATPLHRASHKGHAEVVKVLLQHPGIDVNLPQECNWTPLHRASYSGRVEVVRQLLQVEGIHVSPKRRDGRTPLHDASSKGHVEVVRLLLQHDDEMDVNAIDCSGRTALHLATGNGHLKVTKALLRHDRIDVNVKNGEGETALHDAARLSFKPKLAEQLLQHPEIDVKVKNRDGQTPMLYAVTLGNGAMVESFLQHAEMDINGTTMGGRTLLHWASCHGNIGVVKFLLRKHRHSLQVNVPDVLDGSTPLHLACRSIRQNVVEALLRYAPDIDVNVQNKHQQTPLHCASLGGRYGYGIVKELLQHSSIDITIKDDEGFTPFHYAIKMGVDKMVKLFFTSCCSSQLKHRARKENLREFKSPSRTDRQDEFRNSTGCVVPFLLTSNVWVARVLMESPFQRGATGTTRPPSSQRGSHTITTTTEAAHDIAWMSLDMYNSTNSEGKTLLQLAKEKLSHHQQQPNNDDAANSLSKHCSTCQLVTYLESFTTLSLTIPHNEDSATMDTINPQLDEFQTFLAHRMLKILNQVFLEEISYTIMGYLNAVDVMARTKPI